MDPENLGMYEEDGVLVQPLPNAILNDGSGTVVKRNQTLKFYYPRYGYNIGCEFCRYYQAERGETSPGGSPICASCHSYCYLKCIIETHHFPPSYQVPLTSLPPLPQSDAGPSSAINGVQGPAATAAAGESFTRTIRRSTESIYSVPERQLKIFLTPVINRAQIKPRRMYDDGTYEPVSMEIDNLPNELLARIFKFCDVETLCQATKVCTKWKDTVYAFFEDKLKKSLAPWAKIVDLDLRDADLASVCLTLVSSINCERCFASQIPPPIKTVKRLIDRRFETELDGVNAIQLDDNGYQWIASINGPPDTPYEGGVFYLLILNGDGYPFRPPIIKFITKIFHPNISKHGQIGFRQLSDDWVPSLCMRTILITIQSLIAEPMLGFPMDRCTHSLYRNDRRKYDSTARLWTQKYGMIKENVPGVFKL